MKDIFLCLFGFHKWGDWRKDVLEPTEEFLECIRDGCPEERRRRIPEFPF